MKHTIIMAMGAVDIDKEVIDPPGMFLNTEDECIFCIGENVSSEEEAIQGIRNFFKHLRSI
jgi:hypothetical protein